MNANSKESGRNSARIRSSEHGLEGAKSFSVTARPMSLRFTPNAICEKRLK